MAETTTETQTLAPLTAEERAELPARCADVWVRNAAATYSGVFYVRAGLLRALADLDRRDAEIAALLQRFDAEDYLVREKDAEIARLRDEAQAWKREAMMHRAGLKTETRP